MHVRRTLVLGALIFAVTACSTQATTAVAWQSARDAADDQHLALLYGLDSCQDLDRIEVTYASDAVTVTVFATPNSQACTGVRIARSADVPLRQRLAGRAVRDGART